MKKKNPIERNPVAHHVNTFNKPKVEKDKTKYSRKQKHRTRNSPDFLCIIY
ncbi:hypothetical protein MIJ3_00032 [Pseudomonas phage vB_PaeM_MIJ3]|uniref:Uncharacterized protein n=1 Tax=Pseudomonas phage vB_PaeM_PA5oct TaxID=2163605 RepID=A0A4Y5JVG7_9CAUD|nr:hypothetical protein PQE65_gp293 [Pseudomonas phage vB_PaeM_PA5oct]WMI31735.1 hypothetical protein GBBBJNDB_00032 [Pseudomonas phage Callisto]WPK39185.1 hypothetical protein Cassandra_0509 [Pseudomonas phage Cassandra]WPK39697.1 hypothetical protein Deiofobo_0500 [Pseudomonas phage Deifobo]WPK40218.1 hypothetical protein ETTORE_0509 [Pseudomonas phage Ettore]WPK40733.1 hypothetical protein Paride_0503 [Pseudomonas phage Paride]VOH53634.1 hypothetical protein MIJ3_00032 [Pseudomonas phage v